MRQIIPKEISEMIELQAPYLKYVKGEGMVLRDDTPADIVIMRERVLNWFSDHSMK